ncbi:gamma-aminobutyraldehyde dehydrogenase [Kribbella sandramycini]|uniref:Betaine-aldehyde dehydrogenase n=1 Tax=Kribbella sandramycini TaxID=60450 RepID=A0A7Y4KWD0_9ACTN|nr:gamma-aminobutyraldehyde dehydrogenase [Kribbella sandramycini]MBB6567461.1 betaine-aldehyde dehydrogenase [Kribbella sandramycini]NOL39930.1 gamma-aminobutyraldehyde dehydrogenase [Kribbella sandramycini]
MRTVRNLIGGESRDALSGATSELIDPATGKVFGTAPLSSEEDVDAAYGAAAAAVQSWAGVTPGDRQRMLLRFADALEARADEMIAAESQNTGKPLGLTRDEEFAVMVDQLRFFAGAARLLEGKSAGEYLAGHTSWIRREPIGVVGQITPWNYPMMMAVWKIGPALAAGNTLVLKPAETTPVSTVLMAEIAAGVLPAGVFNVVCGDRATGQAVVAHPTPGLVSITGSTRAGTEVASTAALDLKRTHLELGGKAPAVVFADADLVAAAEAIGVGGFFNAGQDCTAACRVLVEASAHDAFVAALTSWASENARPGLPDDEDALFGPLNSSLQLDRVRGFLARMPAHGAIALGGSRSGGELADGYYLDATVVTGLRQDDEMIQDEVFGPVITVQPFADEAEALELANGVQYGLASSVFTTDHSRALRMSAALDFGCVWLNTHIPLVAEMPHGGFKHSGHGKDLSLYGVEDYTRIKHVMSAIR